MSRISKTFEVLRGHGKRAIIPFITTGDPDLPTTRALLVELARSGADIIELGVPFSDPVADGPVIQRASMRALQNRVTLSDVLKLVKSVREEIEVPIILFSYLNPLLQFGLEKLAVEAAAVGIDGVLVTDMALEEAHDLKRSLATNSLDLILLVAPTTNDQRLQMIADNATGFIYAVSRTGVTGVQSELTADAKTLVERIKTVSDLPVAVGFGISTMDQVSAVWKFADGAVVGSAIVAEIEKANGSSDLAGRVGKFMRNLIPQQEMLSKIQP